MSNGNRYQVAGYDCCGEFETRECGEDFAKALREASAMRRAYPGSIIQVCNLPYVDLGCADGLTEEEREQAFGGDDVDTVIDTENA